MTLRVQIVLEIDGHTQFSDLDVLKEQIVKEAAAHQWPQSRVLYVGCIGSQTPFEYVVDPVAAERSRLLAGEIKPETT